MWTYPALFRDRHGEEATTIENDGKLLRMVVRGIEFVGSSFDLLRPECGPEAAKLAYFELERGVLTACVFEWRMVTVVQHGEKRHAELSGWIELGSPKPGLGGVDVRLTLMHEGIVYSSSGIAGDFEGELIGIQRQLPAGVYMKTCINCAYSDYSPYGQQTFGDMMCFRNMKAQYSRVASKHDFLQLGPPKEDVQETYVCPEFERRQPGTGYRG